MKFNTKAIHGGQTIDPAYNSVMQPIYQTSTYAQDSPGVNKGFEYSRTHNPTRTALQNAFASLENAKYGVAFSSGLAAIDAIIKLLIDLKNLDENLIAIDIETNNKTLTTII